MNKVRSIHIIGLLWLLIVWCWSGIAQAQPCQVLVSSNKVCLGNVLSFSYAPSNPNDSAFVWNFGDGSNSAQSTPVYRYQSNGTYQVTLKIYRKGGGFCDATPATIKVVNKPQAAYQVTSGKKLCFNNHEFVFQDVSGPGADLAPIRRRMFLYGDGGFKQETPPFSVPVKHSYANIAGGTYPVVLEVEDTNGCVSQFIDTVVVFPQIQASFTFTTDPKCGYTDVLFRNTSKADTSGLKVTWLYGDGNQNNADSARLITTHRYYGDTDYYPVIQILDKNGCADVYKSPDPVVTFTPDSTIIIKPLDHRCFNGNDFSFSNPTRLNLDNAYYWILRNWSIGFQADSLKRSLTGVNFPSCGEYNVQLNFFYNGCTFQTDTQVYVYGPKSIIQSWDAPTNPVQCGSHDTVEFRKSDMSCYYQNGVNIQYLWDFDDAFAPPCTTDTRGGLNVGVNCRYSRDSADVKHFYSQPNARCYLPKLKITDPFRNCEHEDNVQLRLSYPNVGWDSAQSPPKARSYAVSVPCTDDPVAVYFIDLEPLCGPEGVWILPDTSCPTKAWYQVSSMSQPSPFFIYPTDICTTDSVVCYAVVGMNGTDALGNACYDTAYYWFKRKLPPLPLRPMAIMEDADLCIPHRVRVYMLDSIRKDIASVTYHFGDSTPPLTIYLNTPADTIISSIYHDYKKSGKFGIGVSFMSKTGCIGSSGTSVQAGNLAALSILSPTICKNNLAVFTARVRYQSDTTLEYWNDTLRAKAGKEQLYWNYGDDTVWYAGTENSSHRYTRAGLFYVRFAYKDSLGVNCFDTLSGANFKVLVSTTVAKAVVSADTFYCAPAIVTFKEEAYVLHGDTVQRPQLIKDKSWAFSNNKGTSNLKEAAVFYENNGLFTATLYAESVYGCIDTGYAQVRILGPEPSFVILEDTFGCVPFTVKLRNQTTKKLRNWIWYFNDPLNTILATNKDTDVTFTYRNPGIYRVNLLGEDSVYNPTTGASKNCTQLFPAPADTGAYHPRQVKALAYDSLSILSADTVCVNQPFAVTATGTGLLSSITWRWGDSTQAELASWGSTQTHSYDTSKTFLISLEPVISNPWQCVLGTSRLVTAKQPEAGFTYSYERFPEVSFNNTSKRAVRFVWDFGDPENPATSAEVNPVHNYGGLREVIKVCLMAFDQNDCMDSVCKMVSLKSGVKIPNVFTPGNGDGYNDAFDIEIEGYEKYQLYIYNRWGTVVFEGNQDGIRDDGVNWDGRDKNGGAPCPSGTYYVVFKYKLFTSSKEETYHGTLTLIRD